MGATVGEGLVGVKGDLVAAGAPAAVDAAPCVGIAVSTGGVPVGGAVPGAQDTRNARNSKATTTLFHADISAPQGTALAVHPRDAPQAVLSAGGWWPYFSQYQLATPLSPQVPIQL